MHAQEIVLITVIASMELVIVKLDLQEKLVLRKHAHLIVIIKDIVLVDLAFAIHNTLVVIVHLLNAQMLVQELEHVLTLHVFVMLVGLVKIVH